MSSMENNIITKNLEPKIYSILFKTKVGEMLYLDTHFTLEDAIGDGKRMAFNLFFPDGDEVHMGEIKMEIWRYMEAEELLNRFTEKERNNKIEIPENVDKKVTIDSFIKEINVSKNKLMQEILDKKSKKEFSKIKKYLSKKEIKYIEDKIK